MHRALAARLFVIISGYVAAAFLNAACHIPVFFYLIPDAPLRNSYIFEASLYGFLVTLQYSFIPSAVAIFIAEWNAIRSLSFYLLSGLLAGFIAWALFGSFYVYHATGPRNLIDWEWALMHLRPLSLITGPLSGYVYWLIAGRNAGKTQGKCP